jgi:hypothetical protein
MKALRSDCIACDNDGHYTVLLAEGPSGTDDGTRYYLPNQYAREEQGGMDPVKQVTFCSECMRKIEDNLRSTIATIQKASGVTPVSFADR